MLPRYPQSTFDEQPVSCSACGWSGTGADAVVISFYGVADGQEVACPACDNRIGLLVKDNHSDPPGESATDLSFQTG